MRCVFPSSCCKVRRGRDKKLKEAKSKSCRNAFVGLLQRGILGRGFQNGRSRN